MDSMSLYPCLGDAECDDDDYKRESTFINTNVSLLQIFKC